MPNKTIKKKRMPKNKAHDVSATTTREFDLPDDLSLVLQKVRSLVQCRLEWLAHLVEKGANLLLEDEPDAEFTWRKLNKPDALNEIDSYDAELAKIDDAPLNTLATLFGLTPPELAVLHTTIAVKVDPTLRNHLGVIQNRAGFNVLTDYVVARLWCFGRGFARPEQIALNQWQIVTESHNGEGLELDPQIFAWLLGERRLHALLRDRALLVQPKEPLPSWPVFRVVNEIENQVKGDGAVVQVVGDTGQGKKTFAASVSQLFGLPLLSIDAKHVPAESFANIYSAAQRQAFLDGCALAWQNLPTCIPGTHCSDFPLQFIVSDKFTLSENNSQHKHTAYVELLSPSDEDKKALLASFSGGIVALPDDHVSRLQIRLNSVGEIAELLDSRGQDLAALDRRTSQYHRNQLSGLAKHLSTPFTRSDWVVDERLNRTLDDIIYEGQERNTLWKNEELNRLFPRGKGLVTLLSGPSGTGKTMCVQVAARELDMDLFRVDLSQVVSKYIGETAENLSKIIHRAERLNVVILFDEADALFSKRTDIKDSIDRHSNMDVNYLLQAIEDYSGIAFLATNKKSNIEPSFMRRLRYVVDFPLPEPEQRLQLWQTLLKSLVGDHLPNHDQVCERLAKQVEVTGAQIKYAILSALFIAQRSQEKLEIAHLIEGIKRELSKDGRSLGEHERAAIQKGLPIQPVEMIVAKAQAG